METLSELPDLETIKHENQNDACLEDIGQFDEDCHQLVQEEDPIKQETFEENIVDNQFQEHQENDITNNHNKARSEFTHVQQQTVYPKTYQEPTEKELCETIMLLKKIMPNRSLERAISMLFECLKRGGGHSDEQAYIAKHSQLPSQGQETGFKKNNRVDENITYASEIEVTKSFKKEDCQKKDFGNSQEESKYKMKRLIGKAFVGKGYGMSMAQEELNNAKFKDVILDKEVYKKLISSVINQAFKRLEAFLIEDCKKNILPTTTEQFKKIITHLINTNCYNENQKVFYKYVRLIYGLSNVTLSEAESVRLYLEYAKYIYGKSISMREIEKLNTKDHASQTGELSINDNQSENQVKTQSRPQQIEPIEPENVQQKFEKELAESYISGREIYEEEG